MDCEIHQLPYLGINLNKTASPRLLCFECTKSLVESQLKYVLSLEEIRNYQGGSQCEWPFNIDGQQINKEILKLKACQTVEDITQLFNQIEAEVNLNFNKFIDQNIEGLKYTSENKSQWINKFQDILEEYLKIKVLSKHINDFQNQTISQEEFEKFIVSYSQEREDTQNINNIGAKLKEVANNQQLKMFTKFDQNLFNQKLESVKNILNNIDKCFPKIKSYTPAKFMFAKTSSAVSPILIQSNQENLTQTSLHMVKFSVAVSDQPLSEGIYDILLTTSAHQEMGAVTFGIMNKETFDSYDANGSLAENIINFTNDLQISVCDWQSYEALEGFVHIKIDFTLKEMKVLGQDGVQVFDVEMDSQNYLFYFFNNKEGASQWKVEVKWRKS